MKKKMNLDLLRNWIRAEIEFAMTCHEVDESGYRQSGRSEEREADRLFNLLKESELYSAPIYGSPRNLQRKNKKTRNIPKVGGTK